MKKSVLFLIITTIFVILIMSIVFITINNSQTDLTTKSEGVSWKNFSLVYTRQNNNNLKEIYNASDHKIKTFGGDVNIIVNQHTYSLEHALKNNIIAENDILEKAKLDAQNGHCRFDGLNDGGSIIFWYDNYSIFKLNRLDGDKDLLIGMPGDIVTLYENVKKITQNENAYSDKLVEMYKTIIDNIMPVDSALNMGTVLYLDVNSLAAPIERGSGTIDNKYMGLSDKEKETLLDYCKKFKSEAKGLSMKDLEEQGIFDKENLYIKNGFLITASNFKECTENSAEMEIMKYYSGLGAVGFTYKLTYENNKWNIETAGAWIS